MRLDKVFAVAMAGLTLSLSARGEDLASCMVGKWKCDGGGRDMWFLGEGVGAERDAEGIRFFVYRCSSNEVTLTYGGGSDQVLTALCGQDGLELMAGTGTNSYRRTEAAISPCATNLLSLEAAIAVFAADHPDATHATLEDVVPRYLARPVFCDEGGVYCLQSVFDKLACSLHGTLSPLTEGEP